MDQPQREKSVNHFSHRIAQRLVELAQPKPGDMVLDVATGAGTAALYAAGKVTPSGQVVGLERASPLLAHARRRLAAVGAAHVIFLEGELAQLHFANDTFDCVLCSTAISLLPDVAAALREWRRVLRPGGTVTFFGYGERSFQPLAKLLETHLQRNVVNLPPRPFFWQRLTDLEAFSELLRNAAFSVIDVRSEQLGYYLANAEEWWDLLWQSDWGSPLVRLAPDILGRFKAEHLAAVAELATEQGIKLNVAAIFAVGQKG